MDVAKTIESRIKEIQRFLFWRGFFHITEGSASIEELAYLANLAMKKNAKLIGEVGFNAGFSSYAFLSAAPGIKVVSFDIGMHWYVKTAKKFIDKKFPGRHTLIYGDSAKIVPQFKKENPGTFFDLVFIDGGHDPETVRADIVNMRQLSTRDSALIIDDLTPWLAWGKGPTQAWIEAIQEGIVVQEELYKDGKSVHAIKPPGERSWALGRYII